jgi:glycosyltransferase involved in cell wall biosynthesis
MKQTLIVVTDQRLLPPWGGNRVRTLGVIRALRALDWRVVLVTLRCNSSPELLEIADRVYFVPAAPFMGGNVDGFAVEAFRDVVTAAACEERARVVIVNYAWMTPALVSLPKRVLRCVDCHDILSERTARFQVAGRDPWVICDAATERRLLEHADTILTVSERDARLALQLAPSKRVVCVLPSIELPQHFSRRSSEADQVLAVGAAHSGNDGIRAFVERDWPIVLSRRSTARLRIAGRIGERLAPVPGVEFVGGVRDLSDLYARAAVVVCPVDVGTGIKIKVLEALRFGKAVVATPAAVEGIPEQEGAWLVADFGNSCANAVADLMDDESRRRRIEHAAFAFGEQWLSIQSSMRALSNAFMGNQFSRLDRFVPRSRSMGSV